MRKPTRVVLAAAWCVVLWPVASSAARVEMAIGTIVSPQDLRRGQEVRPGTTVQAGPDGLVMLSETWPSNIDGFVCESVTVVGYGGRYEVVSDARPGQCPLERPGAPPAAGQPVAMKGVRYAGSKTDGPNVPAVVSASQADWAAFDSWLTQRRAQGNSPIVHAPAGMGGLEDDRSYSGADYRDARVSSAAECSALCASEPQCRAMTFIIDQSRCWLKSGVPPTQPAGGMVSAVKRAN
jgi:hypothetical protein